MPAVPYYELVVSGADGDDVEVLERETGLRSSPLDGSTLLAGELVDRAALHGAIEHVYRLGLDLERLERR